jgi:hypothetical protein
MSPGAGPPCGNNPNFRMSPGDRQVVEEFKAYPARRAAGGPPEADLELPEDDETTGICWCGREKQPGENHGMCYPGME